MVSAYFRLASCPPLSIWMTLPSPIVSECQHLYTPSLPLHQQCQHLKDDILEKYTVDLDPNSKCSNTFEMNMVPTLYIFSTAGLPNMGGMGAPPMKG